jgi:hypothetical protein
MALIFIGAPSPMLIAVGMYLPFPTTMAIFVGGVINWLAALMTKRKGITDARVLEAINNKGLLVSSGFVAGEALMGLILAAMVAAEVRLTEGAVVGAGTGYWIGALVIVGLAVFMVKSSMSAANDPLPKAEAGEDKGEDSGGEDKE